MTRAARAAAIGAAVLLALTSCARLGSPSASNTKPIDLYAAEPTLNDVRSIMGDQAWWPGPPSFGVRPLDSASMPMQEKFHVVQRFARIGTAEALDVELTVWDSTTSATTQMNNIQSAFGTSANGPKVGDQVLYYGSQGSGAAPYQTVTFVRLGQATATITLANKDGFPNLTLLGKLASKVVSRMTNVLNGKLRSTPLTAVDTSLLPPPGPDITLLGGVRLPIEVVVVMLGFASPDALAGILHSSGADTVLFADYVLDDDTHMEVRAGLINFSTSQQAGDWITALRGSAQPDSSGIASFYDDATGQYFTLFTSGTEGAMLVCRSTADGEAASRACESPLSRVAPAWQLSLSGG